MTVVTPLVSVEELQAALAGPEADRPTLLDVRWSLGSTTGRAEHEEAHIPGAAFVDLDEALSGPVLPDGHGGRHPVPDTDFFARAMRAAGVRTDRPSSATTPAAPSRRAGPGGCSSFFGKPDVRVLDGGLTAWQEAGLPTESGEVRPEPGTFTAAAGGAPAARRRRRRRATRCCWTPGRPTATAGENETIDPVAGHIPGARSAPALDNLRPDGRFLPPDDLAGRMAAVGVRPGDDVAVYCGSGVQAAHTALALQVAGRHRRRRGLRRLVERLGQRPRPVRSSSADRRPGRHAAALRPVAGGGCREARRAVTPRCGPARTAPRCGPGPGPPRSHGRAAARRHQLLEQGRGRGLDGGHRRVDGGGVGRRRPGRAADLADVLQRGGVDLLARGRGLEVVQGPDVSAHAPSLPREAAPAVSRRRPTARPARPTARAASFSSWLSSQPSGSATRARRPGPAALALGRLARPGLAQVQGGDQVVERGQRVDQRELVPDVVRRPGSP